MMCSSEMQCSRNTNKESSICFPCADCYKCYLALGVQRIRLDNIYSNTISAFLLWILCASLGEGEEQGGGAFAKMKCFWSEAEKIISF